MVGERLRRWYGLVGLGFRRVVGRATGPGSNRLLVTVTGVAVAVMLMVTVAGVALGLASQSAVQSEDVDYWVVPEGSSASAIAAPTGGTSLGDTHRLTAELTADDRVEYATPVLLQVMPVVDRESGTQEFVLLVGVVPPETATPRVAGLPTAALTPGDPYFADGAYDGKWTGELVLSEAAAELLESQTGGSVAVLGGPRPYEFTVTNVSAGGLSTGIGEAPVALVHLSELQVVTGATTGDAADQILVSTNDPAVRERLETLYPRTTVVTRSGLGAQEASLSSLPLAMAIAAVAISLVVGVLFVATMMGLEVTGDRQNLAVLSAIGYPGGAQALLVFAETVSLSVLGGLLGVALGTGGIALTNALAVRYLGVGDIAVFSPLLVAAGVGLAVAIGVLASPYPLWLARRSDPLEVMRG